jgi:hypothetical protein
VFLAVEVLGAALAVVIAGCNGRNVLRRSKFCEECNRYMKGEYREGVLIGCRCSRCGRSVPG